MFSASRSVLKSRAPMLVLALSAMVSLHAQDTRTVVEPTFPATCTALAAQQVITSAGEPTSETLLDTTRIQSALTACGSGKAVELTVGGTNGANNAFLTAPLNIPSGVTLIVDGGVTLFGSRNPTDYQVTTAGVETCGTVGTAGNGCNPLFVVNNGATSSGSGIMGYGIINGRGGDKLLVNGVSQSYSWWDLANQANTGSNAQNNPILMYLKKANNFTLYKISLLNSPMFHVKYSAGTGFTVWGIKIVTPYSARNTDGIDPVDNTSNVTITNSYLSDGDDNVALGATSGNPVANVTISNTHTYSGHGVSIGSYTAGGIGNVYVNNVNQTGNLADSNSGGLKIKSAQDRGGLVNNISYNNVCIQNIRYPLQFNPVYNTNTGTSYPSYQKIAIHGVSVVGIAGGQDQFEGINVNFPLGIQLDNLNITGTQPALTPATQYTNFTVGPGPVNPAALQSIKGTGVTYTGNITNPSEAVHACPAANFPFLAGEIYLQTSTLNNQKTLSLPNPASFTLNAVFEIVEASSTTPSSAINFYDGATLVGSAPLASNGTLASLTLTGVTSGVHTYTAVYPKDTAYAQTLTTQVTVNVNTTGTTTAMTASPASTNYGANVALTATVTAAAGNVIPTGTVSFQSGSTVFGTATLNASGVAVLNSTTLPVGNNSISAYFQGSSNFGTSDSSATPVNVSIAQAGTVTGVTAAPSPTTYGTGVTITATVNPASNSSGTATGTVTLMDGANILTSITLTGNTAIYSTSALGAGAHSITAVYGGDDNYTSSTSASAASVLVSTITPSVSLGFLANTVTYGNAATMIAIVSPNSGSSNAATGTVTFTDGATMLATVTMSGGSATYATSALAVGPHNIVATYSGDGNYSGPVSSSQTQLTIAKAGSVSTLGATSATITYGTGDSFNATITSATTGTPTGTVTFMDGSTVLGTQTLSGGAATQSVSILSGGSHSITVVYGGDVNFTGSSSSALTVTVTAAASITSIGTLSPIVYGSSAQLSASVSSAIAGTLTGSVTFKDGTTVLGLGTLSGGTASYTASGLSGGTHSITAVYSGDGNYASSTSGIATQTVNKANSSATIAANPTGISYGAATQLTATVTPNTATGTFTFQDAGVTIGTGTIGSGVATFSATALATGSHTLTAIYSGDTNYATSTTGSSVGVTVTQIASTTALAANPSTFAYGGSTLLTATLPSGATGTVTFNDNGVSLGTGTVSSGVATFSATGLLGGTHPITAVYGGDKNYIGSSSSTVSVTVTLAASTTTVSANPASIAYGSATLLTATLTNTAGTGTVIFKDGATTLGSANLSGGSASFNATSLTGGSHSITAVYSGDSNFATSTSTAVSVTVTLATTTTSVNATPPTITFGGSTTLKATISNTAATGTVTFKDGSTVIGSGAVSAGTVSVSVSTLLGGTHSITAVYGGDTNFATSTSTASTVAVNTLTTTTSVAATPSATAFGISVTLSANILPTGGTPSVTGTVTFKDGGTTLGTGTVTNGSASFSLSTLSTGTHSITATYSGDGNYTTSASTTLTVTIVPLTPTVSLGASPSSITFGAASLLTASVTPSTATGTVTFKDSVSGTLGTGTLSGGVATFNATALTGGSHSITAVYSGDVNDTVASSAITTVSVGLASTTTTVAAQPTALNYGAASALTATVSPATATGTVTFKDGAAILGTGTVSGGVATYSATTLSVGSHSITAVYSGDTNNATSTSTAVTVVVALAPTTATIGVSATSASYGTATVLTVTIAPSGATGTVTFKDGSATLGTASLSAGVATYTGTFAAGSHSLSASYSGDANYAASSTATPASVLISVATTSVVASGSPSATALGFTTTLNATVTPAAATGIVTFRDSGTGLSLGTATLSGGTASLSGVLLTPVGTHAITATYAGDSNDGGSTSAAATITILPGTSFTTLANTPNGPAPYGTSVTLSTTNTIVLGVTPTGSVQYFDGSTLLGSAPVTLSAANVPGSTFAVATLAPGTHSLTAVYSGDANYRTNTSAPITFTVIASNSFTTMVATPPQTVPGQTFTLTAKAASALGTGTPTGSITFYDQNNVSLGTVALAGGTASITQSQTVLATYTYTAVYSGDVDFKSSSSAASPTTVIVKQLSSTTSVSANPASGTFGGGTYTVSAVVTPASGGPATGSVTFTDGVNVLGTVALPASDTVSLAGIALLGGVHSITATYSGDPIYTLSVSPTPAVITINTAASSTSVGATPATSTFGTSVTIGAAVSSTTSTVATGTITFMNGSTVLGTATLNAAGLASFTSTTLPIAVYNVTAVYSGDSNFTASSSAATTVTVNQIPQSITSSSIPASLTYGALPFLVTDTSTSGLAVTLAVAGPATLNGSTVTITGAGTVTVTATQAGNATYAAATQVVSTITVVKAALTVSVNNQTIAYGAAIPTLTGSFSGVVNGDSISPAYATTATATSVPGSYPITATLADPAGRLGNYTVTNTPGTLTISATAQTITFPAPTASVTYGVAPITLTATASSNLAVVYTVTGPASVSGTTLTITGAGTVVVTATQPGNAVYSAATPVPQTITVAKAPLTVTAANQSILQGAAIPTLTGTLTGVIGADGITATYATTATATSPTGSYPITATLVDPNGKLGNYTVTNTAGTLSVGLNAQTITFPAPVTPVVYGASPVTLAATASSKLAVTYTVSGPATISGATLSFTGVGTVTVTAAQAGNGSYSAATAVVQTVTVNKAALSVTAANAAGVAGAAIPALSGSVVGVVSGDTITATYATSATATSPAGSYPITATLVDPGGRLANYAVTNTAGTLTLSAPVSLTLSPTSLSLAAGSAGASTLTLSPAAGFTGTVTLTCASPVSYVTCTVTSPVTISGTTAGTANISINVAATLSELRIPQPGPKAGAGVYAAALLPLGALLLLPLVGRRKAMRLLVLVMVVAGMSLGFTGCAGKGPIAPALPPAGAQLVTITATANGVATTTTLTVNITN